MNLERNFYRNSPEANLYSHISEQELTGAEEELADFLNKETNSFRQPSFEEFDEVYSPDRLAKDSRHLRQAVNKFESYSGERSNMVTRLLLHLVYDLEYLKPKDGSWEVYAGSTHPYDDKLRGADMVIVFYNRKTGEELPIAIDTTTSGSEDVLDEKSEKIKQDFKHGNLRKLKYYKSPVDGAPIGQQEMPSLILGYNREQLRVIAKSWRENGPKAFKMLGLDSGLRTIIAEQLALQEESISKIAPANEQARLIEKLDRTRLLINPSGKKEGATEIAPITLSNSNLGITGSFSFS